MSYQDKDTYGMYSSNNGDGSGSQLIGANTLIGNDVFSQNDEDLGDIKEIMLDTSSGKVCYAVLSYGGFLGTGEKLLAVPWQALKLDTDNKRYVLNVDSAKLDSAPGFDKDHWPNMADEKWADSIHSFYGTHFKRTDSLHSGM